MHYSFPNSTLHIESFSLGELQTNCYLVWCATTLSALVIDPADSGDLISSFIVEQNLYLQGVVLTHGHFDHVLGLLELDLNFQAPIYLHAADTKLLAQAESSAEYWLKRPVDPVPTTTEPLVEDQLLSVGDHQLMVLHTPGHTPGSICLLNKDVLFTGDTLFRGSVGRTDFAYSNPKHLRQSLQKLAHLPPDLVILPGHGVSSTLRQEAATIQQIVGE